VATSGVYAHCPIEELIKDRRAIDKRKLALDRMYADLEDLQDDEAMAALGFQLSEYLAG
jgi:hypothetical protein